MSVIFWILAVLIGVPVLLAVVPLRYRVVASAGEETAVRVTVSYFLHLFHVTFIYADKKAESEMRIAGIRLKSTPDEKKKTRVKKRRAKTVSKEKKDLKSVLGEIKAVLTRKDLKIIIALIVKSLAMLFKYLLPKRFRVTGVVGLCDPYQTGIFIGACAAVTGAFNKNQCLALAGDFNNKTLRLKIDAAGRVSAAGLMYPFVRLIFHKPIFNLLIEYINNRRKNTSSER